MIDIIYNRLWRSGLLPGRSEDQVGRLAGDIARAVHRHLMSPDGLGTLHVLLDHHVRRALDGGDELPPEIRAYVKAARKEEAA